MKAARYTVGVVMIVIGLVLALNVAYYVRGSLEEFPGPEDHEKVRAVTGFGAVVLIAAEAFLWLILRRLRKARPPAGPPGAAA